MRTSFILHIDSLGVLDELTDEQAGKLFKAIKAYHYNDVTPLDFALKIAFLPFKNQFDRDVAKYNTKAEANRINGSKGGLKRVANAKKSSVGLDDQADSTHSVSKSVSDSISKKEIFNEFRVLYKGRRRGNDTEYANFVRHKDWQEVLPLLKPSLENQIKIRNIKKTKNEFVPEWKNLQTWINNRCWEQEESVEDAASAPKSKEPTYYEMRTDLPK